MRSSRSKVHGNAKHMSGKEEIDKTFDVLGDGSKHSDAEGI